MPQVLDASIKADRKAWAAEKDAAQGEVQAAEAKLQRREAEVEKAAADAQAELLKRRVRGGGRPSRCRPRTCAPARLTAWAMGGQRCCLPWPHSLGTRNVSRAGGV